MIGFTIGFTIGFLTALAMIQIVYIINVIYSEKGKKLIEQGHKLEDEHRRIALELTNIETALNGIR